MMKRYSIRQRVVWSIGEMLIGSVLVVLVILLLSFFLAARQQVVFQTVDVEVSIKEGVTEEGICQQMDALPYDYALFERARGQVLSGRYQELDRENYEKAFQEMQVELVGVASYHPYANQTYVLVIRLPSLPEFTNPALRFLSYNTMTYLLFFIGEILVIFWSLARLLGEFSRNFQAVQAVSASMGKIEHIQEIRHSRLVEFEELLVNLQEKSEELAQLIAAERQEKKDLSFQVAALAHDVKTPLTVLKGNLELLEMTPLTPQQADFLDSMQYSVQRFDGYFTAMLDYTRSLYEEVDYHEVIIMEDFLEELSLEIESLTQNLDLEWIVTKETELQMFHGNHLSLMRALTNILTNAVQHTQEPKRLRLTVCIEADLLVFQVWNSGQGFSEQALQAGLKLFFTEDKGRSQQHYGIGLSFAQGVAKRHQGRLTLSNPKEGGALVCLSIKLYRGWM